MLSHLFLGLALVGVIAVIAVLVYRNNQRNIESRIASLESAVHPVAGKPSSTDIHPPTVG